MDYCTEDRQIGVLHSEIYGLQNKEEVKNGLRTEKDMDFR